MKIFVQQTKGKPCEINVEPTTTDEEAKEMLIEQHGWSKGSYKFILNGKILKPPRPFSNLSDGARLIVYVKAESTTAKSAPPPPQPTPQPTRQPPPPQPSQPNPQPTPQPSASPSPNQQSPNRTQITQQQLNQMILDFTDNSMIQQLYDPANSFWTHPELLANVEHVFNDNSGAAMIVTQYLMEHFGPAFKYGGAKLQSILPLIGCSIDQPVFSDDYNSLLEQLSNEQRSAFQRILSSGQFDKSLALETFLACDCDEQSTIVCLNEM